MTLKEYKESYNKKLLDNIKNKEKTISHLTELDLIKTNSIFNYTGLPDTINKHELEKILQINGYGIITDINNELVALWGTEAPPYNIYYEPTKVIVANPWGDINKTFTIDDDCILIKNDCYKMGLLPILTRYNTLLCETDITLLCALINMRTMNIIKANDDNEKKVADEFLNKLIAGDLSALLSSKYNMSDNYIETLPYSNTSTNYITQLIEIEQYIRGTKLNEIGLQSNYNMKRERLSSSETTLNEDSLKPLIDDMLEQREIALENVNRKYGTNIKVNKNSAWDKKEDKEDNKNEDN